MKELLNTQRRLYIPDIDVQSFERILKERTNAQPEKQPHLIMTMINTDNQIDSQKIAVTSETINNEFNKNILIELVKRKLVNIEGIQAKDGNYAFMVAKVIMLDLISSFHVLHNFKHHSLLHLKHLLEESNQSISNQIQQGYSGE